MRYSDMTPVKQSGYDSIRCGGMMVIRNAIQRTNRHKSDRYNKPWVFLFKLFSIGIQLWIIVVNELDQYYLRIIVVLTSCVEGLVVDVVVVVNGVV